MDLDVLKGSKETIKKHLPVIFIEHFDNIKSIIEDIKTFLDEFEYSFETIGNNLLCRPQ
jgi:hypothetical protein